MNQIFFKIYILLAILIGVTLFNLAFILLIKKRNIHWIIEQQLLTADAYIMLSVVQ